jgi:hypothetical protein
VKRCLFAPLLESNRLRIASTLRYKRARPEDGPVLSVRTAAAFAAIFTLFRPAVAKPTIQTIDVPNENATTIVAINLQA